MSRLLGEARGWQEITIVRKARWVDARMRHGVKLHERALSRPRKHLHSVFLGKPALLEKGENGFSHI